MTNLAAIPPCISVAIFGNALVIETIHLCNLSGFVVSPEKHNPLTVLEFQQQQTGQSLQTVVAPVYKVTKKHILCICHLTSSSKSLFRTSAITSG